MREAIARPVLAPPPTIEYCKFTYYLHTCIHFPASCIYVYTCLLGFAIELYTFMAHWLEHQPGKLEIAGLNLLSFESGW